MSFMACAKKIGLGLLAFGLAFFAEAHTYPPVIAPYPPVVAPPPPAPYSACYNFNYGSMCGTYSGTCPVLIVNYQPGWFAGCDLGPYGFHCGLNLNLPPAPQNACHLKGSPCACSYRFWNGYYYESYYEPGYVY